MNVYDIGDQIRVSAAFTVDSVATDPTTVSLMVQDPSGNESTYTYALGTVTKSTTGNYYKDITLDEAGTWYYRWGGTGAVVTASEGQFEVRETEFTLT